MASRPVEAHHRYPSDLLLNYVVSLLAMGPTTTVHSASDKDKDKVKQLALNQFSFSQNLLNVNTETIKTLTFHESTLSNGIVKGFVDYQGPLGISGGYNPRDQSLRALAIARGERCLIVEFGSGRKGLDREKREAEDGREKLVPILMRSAGLFAFDMGPLSMALYRDLGLRITTGTDIQSAFPGKFPHHRKTPLDAIKASVGDHAKIHDNNITSAFEDLSYDRLHDDYENSEMHISQRAWISHYLPLFENGAEAFDQVLKIDTASLTTSALDMLSKVAGDSFRLSYLQPFKSAHAFEASSDTIGDINVRSKSFKDRLRSNQDVRVTVESPNGSIYSVKGQTGYINGKAAGIKASHTFSKTNTSVLAISSIGRDGPTEADLKQHHIILRVLQGCSGSLTTNHWIQNIWFSSGDLTWPEGWSPSNKPLSFSNSSQKTLNPSQANAVNCMLSTKDADRITIVQGPPGTGKTSVIATFVETAIAGGMKGIWLVAHSNVAVKNIAEKLASIGFMSWKLLVSKDFHFEWNEHLYGPTIRQNMITSDNFTSFPSRSLNGCHVILSTLNMLSNPRISRFTRPIPIQTLVVDEASQIEIGAYVPVFDLAIKTLHKVCFIGDDKQLPPFGQENIGTLQSIFEVDHLRKYVIFLDTQYRMPPQIGSLISKEVYDAKLNSNPSHPIKNSVIACQFINVKNGQEALAGASSWSNQEECEVVLTLAEYLQSENKSFRIITPYDGQRNLIFEKLKEEGLDWEDKVFNVDSLLNLCSCNEDDYIIISIVRTRSIGFLNDLRRTNVMLTRFKKGQIIVSSRKFLGVDERGREGPGKGSLVSKLLDYVEGELGDQAWLSLDDVKKGEVLGKKKIVKDQGGGLPSIN
ncbi:hypothetical protein D9758_003645 [Tetrapyrgos nigripes]|uniref:DNA2/NAM7 helicase-like C-terminal domain-containing protein n=1 Tax=Tetrapyrgos nigripes TaxID=182062 RepID=A0A8H5GMN3_9AGAR|nr:hypothetical protein D9758_003645 [Tetrapyrgos nigripes]